MCELPTRLCSRHQHDRQLVRQKPATVFDLDELGKARGAEPAAERTLVEDIRDVLENDIAVALRNDGGDIELVRVREHRVFVRLMGNCAACRLADVTLKAYVEKELRRLVRDDLVVVEVTS